MFRIRVVNDPDECRRLWQQILPQELISDLWEVRECFHSHYQHRLHFVVAECQNHVCGLLPLVWNEDTGQYNYFPGETWEGKSWLEQNRIIASNKKMLDEMLDSLDKPYYLRYLKADERWHIPSMEVDELGYLFNPEDYDFNLQKYFEVFSHKTAKKLGRELAAWEQKHAEWRFDDPGDFDTLIQMNRSRFGRLSYFYDERFLGSFQALMRYLHSQGWLRMVTVLVEGEPAAVDMGSLYQNRLTMLAGGTSEKFPGIAKLINVHHMEYACHTKLSSVDFLCGDFNWKTLFHLKPAPLYLLAKTEAVAEMVYAEHSMRPLRWQAQLIHRGALHE
jgi:hypothetical protein